MLRGKKKQKENAKIGAQINKIETKYQQKKIESKIWFFEKNIKIQRISFQAYEDKK